MGLKINIYSRGITQTGTRNFSPGWYYQPGLKIPAPRTTVGQGPLLPEAKNVEVNVKLGHRSKVCSLVVNKGLPMILTTLFYIV